MCGRLSHKKRWREIYEHLERFSTALTPMLKEQDGPAPSYNAPPTAPIPVLRSNTDGLLEGVMLRWWLIPHWAKSSEAKYAMFNARSEDAAKKPAFRDPFKRRRCVIPADGFYEWQKRDAKTKQPYFISRADGDPMYLAGLWERWQSKDDESEVIESCTILTTMPNAEMTPIHNRMPCIIEPEQVQAWCDPSMQDVEGVESFLHPAADGLLVMHEVSSRVGNVRNNDEALTQATIS
ncbi:MAG: SOS response-associated peptidase [Phycisphaeraceae bacterium]|nr:SOS response-associated peptidase [Phycisphaerales bacterium]MCB9860858.1 SOS response-associated peptidase [Phycisphaeraceae bacterium]